MMSQKNIDDNVDAFDPCRLSTFQHTMLYVLFGKELTGMELYRRMDRELSGSFSTTRLYSNLETLEEMGMVEPCGSESGMTPYRVSPSGERWLRARRAWEFEWSR